MSGKEKMTTIWITWDTYRKILQVKGEKIRVDGRVRNPDEVVKELIKLFRKEHKV